MTELFTKQEKLSIILILFGIIIGAGIELHKSRGKPIARENDINRLDEIETQIQQKAALIDTFIAKQQTLVFLKSENQRSEQNSPFAVIDINNASIAELEKLPGIGAVIAKRIMDYRDHHGPFQTPEELTRVKGIGAKKLNSLKPYIKTGKR